MLSYLKLSRWTIVLGGISLLFLASSLGLRGTRPTCGDCVLTQAAKLAASVDPTDPFARFGPDAKKMEFLVRTKGGRVQKLAACFAPDTPPEKMAEFLKHMRMQSQGAWPTHQTGGIQPSYYTSGATWPYNPSTKFYPILVSFVPDGTTINGYVGEPDSPSTFQATISSQFGGGYPGPIHNYWGDNGTYAPLHSRILINGVQDDGASFDSADGLANTRGDVRVGMHPIDGPGGLLGYAFFPGPGVGGNIVLDSAENWAQGGAPYRFYSNVTNHEFGHALGLEHVCPIDGTKLMEPVVSLALSNSQHDDIRGLQELYQDPSEPDDTLYGFSEVAGFSSTMDPSDAWSYSGINVSNGGDPLVSRFSLRDHSDNDYLALFLYGLPRSMRIDLSVFPVGTTYADNPQNADGTCATGNTTNSLALADIAVEVWNMYGEFVASVNDHGPGEAESFTELYLPNNQSYTIRVYSVNSFNGPQMFAFKARRYFDVPIISDLAPNNIGAGSSSFPMKVTVSNPPQSARAVVYWNGSPRSTTTTSNGYIATIPASDVAVAGTASVRVYNPEIGGGMSNPLTFNITTAPATVTPESFQLVRGRAGVAGLSQLFYSDDNRMGLKPGFVLSSSEAPVDLNLTATSPFANPSQISFKLESRAGTSNIRQTVYLYNYTSGGWESADVRQTPTSDTSITITPPSAAANYVSPINRQIKARMTYKASGAVLYYPWDIDIDQGIWNISQ